jgi:2-phosphoglycolate phosphatase
MNRLRQEPLHAILFDFDGTLADTFPLIAAAFNAAMHEPLGRQFSDEEVVARFGVPDEPLVRRELQEHPSPIVEAAIEKYFGHYRSAHGMVQPFAGVEAMLQTLYERGIPMGLMTGKGRRAADISLQMLGWEKYFGSVVTGDEIPAQKPAPDGVLMVAQALNIAPQHCAYVGDSPIDIEAGKAAGMLTIGAAWHAFYREKLRAATADLWAETPEQIVQLMEKQEL